MATRTGARARAAEFVKRLDAPAIDAAEAAQLLRVSRSRVNQLAIEDPTFPRPVTIMAGSRYWYRPGIELWASLHRPNRPYAHGSFGSEAAELLRLAEQASAELNHAAVGDVHVWLALVDPRAPGVPRKVLESLGVDRAEIRAAVLRGYPPGDAETYAPGLRMSPHVQAIVGRSAAHAAELGSENAGTSAIALSLLDEWPASSDKRRPGGDPVTGWLFRRGLDVNELRRRIAACSADPGLADRLERRVLPKRRPAASRRRPAELRDLAPNPLGHDPWDRHPWGSIFARLTTGKSWIEKGIQYFFFYDRDRYRIKTRDGRPVGYWWQIDPKPTPQRPPKGSNGAVVLPLPGEDVDWPDRLPAFKREHLLTRRPPR